METTNEQKIEKPLDTKLNEQKTEELTDSLKRLQADFINFKRRTEEESRVIRKKANAELIKELLDVTDNLERAIKQVPKEQQNEFYKGVELTFSQFISILENQGIQKIPNEVFNAHIHEAILSEVSDKPKGTIIEVLQQGYILAGKIIRTSKVKISSGGKKQ